MTIIIKFLRDAVCDPNANITMRSSDNILFIFDKRQLGSHSGVFASAEIFPVSTDELVELPEPSEVVDLLLQLMSLQEAPDLKSLGFQTLAKLAEAVEKYDVFHSKTTCRMLMQYVNPYFLREKYHTEILQSFHSWSPSRSARICRQAQLRKGCR